MGALRDYVEGRGLDKPRTFEARLAEFRAAKDDWFDGTPQSIDHRLQKCASLVATAESAAADDDAFKATPYLAALAELSEDRRALASLRDDLLTGASGREATYNPPGRRLANDELESDEEYQADRRNKTWTDPVGRDHYIGSPEWGQQVKDVRKKRRLDHDDNRWVELESSRFLADNRDAAHDSWELSERARHHAEKATSTMPPGRSRALTAAFVDRVIQRGQQTPRPRVAAVEPVFIGYRDEQLFL